MSRVADDTSEIGVGHLATIDGNDDIKLILVPGFGDLASHKTLVEQCESRCDRFAILGTPIDIDPLERLSRPAGDRDGLHPPDAARGHAAVRVPWIEIRNGDGVMVTLSPSGHIARAFAKTDSSRGVHEAPANIALRGALGLTCSISDIEQE